MLKTTLKTLISLSIITTLSIAQKEALIIGVSDYAGVEDDLKGIEIDINNMKNLFEKWGFNVTLLRDASSMRFDDYMQNYHNLGENDTFALYYSGHGSQTRDTSGDEADGIDETIVLSDGNINKHYVDDDIYTHLNQIRAKKLVIFDSCHSGTAFKAFGDKPRPKSINSNKVNGIIKAKGFRHQQNSEIDTKGEYIIFSASQDKEESLATNSGSLFTNAFVNEFKNGGESKEIANITQAIDQTIYSYCQKNDSTPHHPNLSASNTKLKYITMAKFLQSEATPPPPPPKVEPKISIMVDKLDLKEGELLKFKIDTKQTRGYLTIFSIENGEPFIMAQTSNPVGGILSFQDDFNINPPIEAYKSCKNCPQEVSTVYIILSAKPLTKNIMKTKGLQIGNQPNMRAFRHRTNSDYEPIIAKVKFTIK